MDDWIDVLEDTPQFEIGMKNVSRTVLVLLSDQTTTTAFYGYKQDKWFFEKSGKVIPKRLEVIAWMDK